MITRTQRTLLVAAGVAAIVVAANASDGAYFSQSWGWVALSFLVPSTLLVIFDRVSAPGPLRVAFASAMGALGVWIALSTIWSISVPASAREAERLLVYVSVALAIALVLRRGDGPGVVAGAFAGVTLVSAYGLATRLFPDRFDASVDLFNETRLAEPLGYWNAFGLLTAIGAILAVALVVHPRRSLSAVVGGAAGPLFVVALYLSFSRGSWVALFFGLGAAIALDPRRLTVLWSLLLLAPASIAGVAFASRQDALTTDNVPAADVAREGHRLAWVLAALMVASALLGWLAHRGAHAFPTTPRVRRGAAVALAGVAMATGCAAVLAVGGPGSAVAELRDRFEATPPAVGPSLNDRLFSISGTGRAQTIEVAWDAALDDPVVGNGAGTFEILWYERRPIPIVVRDAHSLYAETFSELGIVGLTLLVAALVVPIVAAIRSRRSRFVAPAAGAYLAWLAASGLDWHWEMVGLTMTALLVGAVGLVSAERRSARRPARRESARARRGPGDPERLRGLESRGEPGAVRRRRGRRRSRIGARRSTMPALRRRSSCGRTSPTSFAATPPRVSVIAKERSAPTEPRPRRIHATGSRGFASPRSHAAPRRVPRTTGCVNSNPVSGIYWTSELPKRRLALALLASPEDEPAGNKRATDGDDAEKRKTSVRKRLGLCGGRGGVATCRRRDLNARDLVSVLVRGRGLRIGSASQCQEQPDDKGDVCSREQRG